MKRLFGTMAVLMGALLVLLGTLSGQSAAAPPTTPTLTKLVGMSAPSNLWSERLTQVGSCGVEARRIFASLTSNGRSQSTLIQQAVSQGMMPVISYKVPSVSTLNSGGYASWLAATRTYLSGLGVQVTATFHHEPYGDMTPAEFLAGSQRFLTGVKAPNVAVGPILNGWLLDRRVSDFAALTSPALLTAWDFVAVDSYQSGTQSSPGPLLSARAIPLLENWLDSVGHPDKPIGLGEYNGYTQAAIKAAGDAILSTPEVWFGLAFNSDVGAKGYPLTGDRLTAYKTTKADSRAKRDTGC